MSRLSRLSRRSKNKHNRAVKLVSYLHPRSPITEQYRLIRNNLHFSSVDKDMKSIIVTSSEPAEGKSTTAANLAIVLSQQGKKVLLVDTDLRKPSVHYSFELSNLDGLTCVLTKKINIEQAIISTSIPNLDVITSGPIPPNPSELLDSKSMEYLIKELEEQYDYIIYDTPPLLAVTDSQVMASKCDGVVMVIGSGKTKKERVRKAIELLGKANAVLLGVVVNGIEPSKSEYYGHYG